MNKTRIGLKPKKNQCTCFRCWNIIDKKTESYYQQKLNSGKSKHYCLECANNSRPEEVKERCNYIECV